MFTGIIEGKGQIAAIQYHRSDRRFLIKANTLDLFELKMGDSIAVNGACLTVIATEKENQFSVDVSAETLSCTTFSGLVEGQPVNLERALMLSSRLAGHLVSGHIDGVGKIEDIVDRGRSIRVRVSVPATLMKYITDKGAICVDGVSLTVNDCASTGFAVNIIPYTFKETLFSSYSIGTKVNLEIDLIMRYLETLLHR